MDEKNDEMLETFRRFQPFMEKIRTVAGFELPPPIWEKLFTISVRISRKPLLDIVNRLTIEGGSRRDWFDRFHKSLIRDVHEGLCATYYHTQNIQYLETQVKQICDEMIGQLGSLMGYAGGNTRRMTYEYQAFQFAYRRTLEYLSSSISAFFKKECHSIRDLTSILEQEKNNYTAQLLLEHMKGAQFLDAFISSSEDRSVRDRLAHWEAVTAGNVAVTTSYAGLVGGGENINPVLSPKPNLHLTPELDNYIKSLEDFIFKCYDIILQPRDIR